MTDRVSDLELLAMVKPVQSGRTVATRRGGDSFGADLMKELKTEERKKPLTKKSWLRVHELVYMCAREELLALRRKTIRVKVVTADVVMYRGIGSEFHKWVQRYAQRLLVGAWMCLAPSTTPHSKLRPCGYRTDGSSKFGRRGRVPMPKECPLCGAKHGKWKYVEATYKDKAYKTKGHPDGFRRLIDEDPDEDEVLEFKTAAEFPWSKMDEPYPEYVDQLQSYMWLTGLKRGRIILVNKNGSGAAPSRWFKEFVYGRDENAIERLKKKAVSILSGVANDQLADRICMSKTCKMAKGCSLVEPCFRTEEGVA